MLPDKPTDMLVELDMGDVIRLRKPHPCGGSDWVVVRLGADIGIKCLGCGRRILLPRRALSKRMKGWLRRGKNPGPGQPSPDEP